MVLGIDSFREKFTDYTDYYTIIGGTACDILLTEADLPFRAKYQMVKALIYGFILDLRKKSSHNKDKQLTW